MQIDRVSNFTGNQFFSNEDICLCIYSFFIDTHEGLNVLARLACSSKAIQHVVYKVEIPAKVVNEFCELHNQYSKQINTDYPDIEIYRPNFYQKNKVYKDVVKDIVRIDSSESQFYNGIVQALAALGKVIEIYKKTQKNISLGQHLGEINKFKYLCSALSIQLETEDPAILQKDAVILLVSEALNENEIALEIAQQPWIMEVLMNNFIQSEDKDLKSLSLELLIIILDCRNDFQLIQQKYGNEDGFIEALVSSFKETEDEDLKCNIARILNFLTWPNDYFHEKILKQIGFTEALVSNFITTEHQDLKEDIIRTITNMSVFKQKIGNEAGFLEAILMNVINLSEIDDLDVKCELIQILRFLAENNPAFKEKCVMEVGFIAALASNFITTEYKILKEEIIRTITNMSGTDDFKEKIGNEAGFLEAILMNVINLSEIDDQDLKCELIQILRFLAENNPDFKEKIVREENCIKVLVDCKRESEDFQNQSKEVLRFLANNNPAFKEKLKMLGYHPEF